MSSIPSISTYCCIKVGSIVLCFNYEIWAEIKFLNWTVFRFKRVVKRRWLWRASILGTVCSCCRLNHLCHTACSGGCILLVFLKIFANLGQISWLFATVYRWLTVGIEVCSYQNHICAVNKETSVRYWTLTVKLFHRYRIGTSNCYITVGSTKVFGNPPPLHPTYTTDEHTLKQITAFNESIINQESSFHSRNNQLNFCVHFKKQLLPNLFLH